MRKHFLILMLMALLPLAGWAEEEPVAPEAKTGLVYNATPLDLVTAGVAEQGKKYWYAVVDKDATAAYTAYAATASKKTDAGSYDVYFIESTAAPTQETNLSGAGHVTATIAAKNQRIADLEAALKACEAKPAVVQTVTNTKDNLECYVYFNQGKHNISAAQQPNVERIATFLKNHAGSKVVIKGYASPEGSVEVNERIARQRAEAVKTMLINKYKIAADRISAEGQGVGNSFSEPDWNRVSICTIQQ